MDYLRQTDIFDPAAHDMSATIIGCGGIGSFSAFALSKLGVSTFNLLDFDSVESHNVPNQLFTPAQVGASKVEALAETIKASNPDAAITLYNQPLQDGFPLTPLVVSALDGMDARKDCWDRVKYQLPVKLFLDGRLGGQNVVLYSARPTNPEDVAGYEATLHSDAEGIDLPCTGRAIIDVGFSIASMITRAARTFATSEQTTPMAYLNQESLELLTGGWS